MHLLCFKILRLYTPLVKYGGGSPMFIWAPFHVMCTAVLTGWDPQTPPRIWTRITRALLVSTDRRHLFVTPWYNHMSFTPCWLIDPYKVIFQIDSVLARSKCEIYSTCVSMATSRISTLMAPSIGSPSSSSVSEFRRSGELGPLSSR